jgi:hypothetical protein
MVIIFARSPSDSLGKLVRSIDAVLEKNKKADLRAWVTFVGMDQPSHDPQILAWAQKQAIKAVPLGIFEDSVGPPTYVLNREADVTVLLAVKQRVRANFAFRSGELTDSSVADISRAVDEIVAKKK